MTDTTDGSIKAFWDARAADKDAPDAEVTHRDVWQRWLEIETLKAYLRPSDRVLDVGCGNGFTTRRIAPLVREIVGIDYSAEMIDRAMAAGGGTGGHATFRVLDVLAVSPAVVGEFDLVVSERCLINLQSWDAQQAALQNLASVVRPGGRLIMMEGTRQGRDQLNALRLSVGLPAMPPVWHNLDFDERALLTHVGQWFDVEEVRGFGLYDLLARVVHPLLVAPEEPRYDARINELAARLAIQRSDARDVSRVIVLVLRKR